MNRKPKQLTSRIIALFVLTLAVNLLVEWGVEGEVSIAHPVRYLISLALISVVGGLAIVYIENR